MPYQKQEVPIIILAYLLNAIADELEIEAMQVGALLLEKEELQRAIEPDTCLYIQHQALVISKVAESESFIVITGISAYRTFFSTATNINSDCAGMISNPRFILGRKVESSCQQIIRAIFIFLTHSQQSTVNSQQ
jgi:hypothetical protein